MQKFTNNFGKSKTFPPSQKKRQIYNYMYFALYASLHNILLHPVFGGKEAVYSHVSNVWIGGGSAENTFIWPIEPNKDVHYANVKLSTM